MRLQEKLCELFDIDTENCIDVTITIKPDSVSVDATYQKYMFDVDELKTVDKSWKLVEVE